jgi:3-dehydroquinate synthetase
MSTKFYKSLVTEEKTKFIIDDSKSFKGFDKVFFHKHPKVFIFADTNVLRKHKLFLNFVSKLNKKIYIKKIISNEKAKNIVNYSNYIDFLSSNSCSRKDLIIGIGGGVVLDIAGFVASTYMRKINLMLVPTNLIGMADASTAGKTCLNTNSGKNMIGTFYLPNVVYNNINFLQTGSNISFRQGFSEIFKYGLLSSKELVDLMIKYKVDKSNKTLKKILKLAIDKRFEIRMFNPLASNLGHTFGHAIEKMTNYKIKHGDAISIGTIISLRFSLEKKLITKDLFNYIYKTMKYLDLKTFTKIKFNNTYWVSLMLKDKKSYDDNIGLILIKGIGLPVINKKSPFFYVKKNEMIKFLNTI